MGGAVHADDLRTTAASSDSISKQDAVINSFTSDSCLKLNTTKLEMVKISPYTHDTAVVKIGNSYISTSNAAKCLGVWWNSSLSAKHSVIENINKARRAFFALGSLGAFQGDLNPLSSCSIFETCIIPTLLYGSETWLLDSTSLNALESSNMRLVAVFCVYQNSIPSLLFILVSTGPQLRPVFSSGNLVSSASSSQGLRILLAEGFLPHLQWKTSSRHPLSNSAECWKQTWVPVSSLNV